MSIAAYPFCGTRRAGHARQVAHALAIAFLLGGGLMLGGGADEAGSSGVAFEPIIAPPELNPLLFAGRSGIDESREIVVRNAEGWNGFWTEHTGVFGRRVPLPPVDFADEMVVGVVLGDRGTGAVAITRIRTAANALMVSFEWRIRGACPGRFFVEQSPQPLALVRLRRLDGPVRFEESLRIMDCR